MEKLKISIITVSYNAVKTIEQTIQSVVNQTFDNIEYIIIDGGSTDGTINIIKKYEDKISYWVSESDNGIYDAMNKGIAVATGDYIYFIGSDDWIYDDKVIVNVARKINMNGGMDFYCGNVILYDDRYNLIKNRPGDIDVEDIKKGNMYPHQGIFTKSSIMKQGFNTKYKIAADYEFLLKNILAGRKLFYLDMSIAFYNVNGASSDKNLYLEYKDILSNLLHKFDYINPCEKKNLQYSIKKVIKLIIKTLITEKVWLQFRGWEKYNE